MMTPEIAFQDYPGYFASGAELRFNSPDDAQYPHMRLPSEALIYSIF